MPIEWLLDKRLNALLSYGGSSSPLKKLISAAVMERHICDSQEVSGAAEMKRKISDDSERSQVRAE